MSQIELANITKEFISINKKAGIKGALANLFHAEKKKLFAVDDISFDIEKGEIVGYIGPNGAGKSTTVKMMSGILNPTSGSIYIEGISPQKDRKSVVRKLGVVFGQRTQLYWDLRLGESFELLKRIYNVDDKTYNANYSLLSDILNIQEIVNTPVRQLSLGQRMKGELVAAMLHSPSILFLDEPTIGLDIEAKHAIRKFIKDINVEKKVTVILTTHDLADVSELCKRLIVINHGKVVEDNSLDAIIGKISPYRYLILDLEKQTNNVSHDKMTVEKTEGTRIWCKFNKNEISASHLISDLSKQLPIQDLSVKEPDIEEVIKQLYHTK